MTVLKNTVSAIALLALATAAGSAVAAEEPKGKSAGSIMVRARALAVVPAEKGSIKTDPAGASTGLNVRVDEDYIPEVDASYFFTDNIAAELIAGTSRHRVHASNGTDAGSVRLLPPTLTLQYHFNPKGQISPYLGAGVNYTIFYDKQKGTVLDGIDYKNRFGVALQAGMDVSLGGAWYLNMDVKKLWLKTDAKLNATTALGTRLKSDVSLNPWIVGVGVGYVF